MVYFKPIDYEDVVNYWYDMVSKEFPNIGDKEVFYNLYKKGVLKFFCIDLTGIFAYIVNDFAGTKGFCEVLFYIMPKFRGNLRLVRKYITKAEHLAKENGCGKILIGANIGNKDTTFIKLLKRWGYTDNVVAKEIV